MGKITDALLWRAWDAEQHVLPDKQRYDMRICQCCGYEKQTDYAVECVCDQQDWYMLPGGGVECQIHRMMRAMGQMPTVFGPEVRR